MRREATDVTHAHGFASRDGDSLILPVRLMLAPGPALAVDLFTAFGVPGVGEVEKLRQAIKLILGACCTISRTGSIDGAVIA
jgi:hypothetical protein